ncbi:enoyl-CoA hydratase/isomerase family protein [Chloroflexota bacterium]
MEFQNITLEKQEGISRLTISRPPVNVMDCDTIGEISAALDEVAKDDEVKILLIRGAGNRAFCAGVEVKDHIGDMVPVMMNSFGVMIGKLRKLGKPSIAVVNGVALGGGCELVAGCDMAVASEKAEFAQPEIKLGGLAPAAAALFPAIMGEKVAFELILLGDNINAERAEKIGLVNRVVPDEDLDEVADGLARKFLEKTPLGVSIVREAFYKCVNAEGFEDALKIATDLGIKSWETDDAQEGLQSFLEKRPPVWKNK